MGQPGNPVFNTLHKLIRLRLIIFAIFVFTAMLSLSLTSFAATQSLPTQKLLTISLDTENELTIRQFPAKGNRLLIWVPSHAMPVDIVNNLTVQLAAENIEVWYADLLEARFLPHTSSSIYQIPTGDIIKIYDTARKQSSKQIAIYTESRAVIPVLHALREQQQSGDDLRGFGGLIVNSPYFYVETPDPGNTAQLMPITSTTNLPIYVIQPKNSPRYWQLREYLPALQQSGSDVFVRVLDGIRGRFLFRPDASLKEDALTSNFGKQISRSLNLLDTVNNKPRDVTQEAITPLQGIKTKKDRYLQGYQGSPTPPPLKLPTLTGDTLDLRNIKNQVVLVNFWTTWCPPCVDEMPSMQRLSEKLQGDPFAIWGVNIAEQETEIKKFVTQKINVDFPILLDSSGEAMRQWNVMAFPTSFVIDKKGNIRYALFGSIDWDTPEIIKKIQTLLNE